MSDEQKKKLIEIGRQDLVDTFELTKSGFAGINEKGTIVDRRKFPNAVPIQENGLFGVPKPEKI